MCRVFLAECLGMYVPTNYLKETDWCIDEFLCTKLVQSFSFTRNSCDIRCIREVTSDVGSGTVNRLIQVWQKEFKISINRTTGHTKVEDFQLESQRKKKQSFTSVTGVRVCVRESVRGLFVHWAIKKSWNATKLLPEPCVANVGLHSAKK